MNEVARYNELWSGNWGDLQRYGPTSRHQRRVTSRILDGRGFGSVLDVGCGEGSNLAFLQGRYAPSRAVGLDLSAEAVARARKRCPGAAFHVGDATRAAELGPFDLVTCIDVLEHVERDAELVKALARASARWVFCVSVQGRMRPGEAEIGHLRNYRRGQLASLMRDAGLRVVREVEWGFPFYSPVFRSAVSGSGGEALSYGRYGLGKRLACHAIYGLFLANSWSRGDRVFVLGEKT